MSEGEEYARCGYEKEDGEPCGLAAGWGTNHVGEGRCRNHPGRGAPEGNQNAVGNSGGPGGPEGNTKAMKHGLYMTIKRQYESFGADQREAFQFYVEYYHEDRDLDDLVQAKVLAILEVLRDGVEADLADSLYETRYTDAGAEIEVLKEGMLEAHTTYVTAIRLKQHYEGISRHPSVDQGGQTTGQFLEQLPDGMEGS